MLQLFGGRMAANGLDGYILRLVARFFTELMFQPIAMYFIYYTHLWMAQVPVLWRTPGLRDCCRWSRCNQLCNLEEKERNISIYMPLSLEVFFAYIDTYQVLPWPSWSPNFPRSWMRMDRRTGTNACCSSLLPGGRRRRKCGSTGAETAEKMEVKKILGFNICFFY